MSSQGNKSLLRGVILLPNVGDGSYGAKARFTLTEAIGKDDKTAMLRLREDMQQGLADLDFLLKLCGADGRCKERDSIWTEDALNGTRKI